MGELFALSAGFSWAIACLFFRKASYFYRPISINIFKSLFASLLFTFIFLINNDFKIIELNSSEWIRLTISALLGISISDTLVIYAIKKLGNSNAAITECFYLPCMMFFAFVFHAELIHPFGYIGSGLIIFSVYLASKTYKESKITKSDFYIGVLLGFLTQVSVAISIHMIKDLYQSKNLMWIIAYRFCVGTLFMVLFEMGIGKTKELIAPFKWKIEIKYLLGGSFFGSFLACWFWFLGFKYTESSYAAIFNQLSIIFIVILSAIFLKERITRNRIWAVGFAFTGAVMTNLARIIFSGP